METFAERQISRKVKIAYIGGGSRGWAWGLMRDLALCDTMRGEVFLYDIDHAAAKDNEAIGNSIGRDHPDRAGFLYRASETIEEALDGADFVVISILPGTFDEMESDVHAPEEFGIYQSVGDTTGLGGLMRALRALPMFFHFGEKIRECCPGAYVINYTNPMALCVGALYKAFPAIRAFGCCHEVFGTQEFLCNIVCEMLGIPRPNRGEIAVNVLGVNHFTWITEAHYGSVDLFPVYREYCLKHAETGDRIADETPWRDNPFASCERIKMDLFLRFGYIAAAGDRHLAEFCPNAWYLRDPGTADGWCIALTPVSWRKRDLEFRLNMRDRLIRGEEKIELFSTGEEGVRQMTALLGGDGLITNVNLPNTGQIPNLPLGTVVETNAVFTSAGVVPVFAGSIPEPIKPLIDRSADLQPLILEAAWRKDLSLAFEAFVCEQQNNLSLTDSEKLFRKMVHNTKNYLEMYKDLERFDVPIADQ
ncbi:MAG: alpha-glucosidase/alpha-galactosidase [Clostridia bacterium]|nr:alpha-glucosidase/alpha-galactosidase [Clostridia bacterium]